MSNQYISDKKRADAEDELHRLFELEIRILDRTWILDKVFSYQNNKLIAIHCFRLSDALADEVCIGARDFERKKEWDSIEEKFKSQALKRSEYVPLSRRSVHLGRELEVSKDKILSLLSRYESLAKKYGTELDTAEAIYDTAWTIYWWYPDAQLYYRYYCRYEELALDKSTNVYLFENLITLWINLYASSLEEDIDIELHTKNIQKMYDTYVNDSSKPNAAIEARASYQLMRFFLGDNINDIVNDYIDILCQSKGHLDLDLYPLSRVIQEFTIFEEATNYNELFEMVIEKMSQQDKDATAALMLAKRGQLLMESNPYEALSLFSRTLMKFCNEKNKHYLIITLMKMGCILENVGLFWAARNFYYYDFCLCLNQYMKYGEVSQILFVSARALKYIELKLGQVLYSTEFHFLEHIAIQLYPEKVDTQESDHDNYDYLLGIHLLQLPFESLNYLSRLPEYLSNRGLMLSSTAIQYELGYYDEQILKDLANDKEVYDDMISKWVNQPIGKKIQKQWFGFETPYSLKTNVLGCAIEVMLPKTYSNGEIEVAATILATIESFFGTGLSNDLLSLAGKIIIFLEYNSNSDCFIKGGVLENNPSHIKISVGDYDPTTIISAQDVLHNFLLELLGMLVSIMFPFESEFNKVKSMVVKDDALARALVFTNSIFYGLETLGKDLFCYENVLRNYEPMELVRKHKSEITICKDNNSNNIDLESVSNDPPLEKLKLEDISHTSIITSSVINIPLWNKCDWKGVMFLSYLDKSTPPLLAPIFTKPLCKNIFEEWIKEYGTYDKNDNICIRIIKGINSKKPFWYRVIIGSDFLMHGSIEKGTKLIMLASRLHTMEAVSDQNLRIFERSLNEVGSYLLCPAHLYSSSTQPELFEQYIIRKNGHSIKVLNAWEY